MPIGEDFIKTCKCCGKKSVSIDIYYLCMKCKNNGHTGLLSCKKCKEIEESKENKKDE